MSGAVEMDEDQRADGYYQPDWAVCENHVHDKSLQAAVNAAADPSMECTLCSALGAADGGALLAPFMWGVRRFYEPADGSLHTSLEMDEREIVEEFASEFDDLLFERIVATMYEQNWQRVDWWSQFPDDTLLSMWQEATSHMETTSRIQAVFRLADDLKTVTSKLETWSRQFDLIKPLPSGTMLHRASTHHLKRETSTWDAPRFGTIPATLPASNGRMNAAGIPTFYGAEDRDTARKEVLAHADAKQKWLTFSEWRTERDLKIIDFVGLPKWVSPFDKSLEQDYFPVRFLHKFARTLSGLVDPEWQAIRYLPTQLVADYFINIVGLDGIRFPSARQKDGVNYALKIDNANCVLEGTPRPSDSWNPAIARGARVLMSASPPLIEKIEVATLK